MIASATPDDSDRYILHTEDITDSQVEELFAKWNKQFLIRERELRDDMKVEND